jgi:hypothetical protein
MSISYDLRTKHDRRAQQLGFDNRFALRRAVEDIANSMTYEEFESLTDQQLNTLLKQKASND